MSEAFYATQLGNVSSFVRRYGTFTDMLARATGLDRRWPIVPLAITGIVGVGPLGFLDDVVQAGSRGDTPPILYGDYFIDQHAQRWVVVSLLEGSTNNWAPLAIPWPTGTPDLITTVGVTPAPTTRLARFVGFVAGGGAPLGSPLLRGGS